MWASVHLVPSAVFKDFGFTLTGFWRWNLKGFLMFALRTWSLGYSPELSISRASKLWTAVKRFEKQTNRGVVRSQGLGLGPYFRRWSRASHLGVLEMSISSGWSKKQCKASYNHLHLKNLFCAWRVLSRWGSSHEAEWNLQQCHIHMFVWMISWLQFIKIEQAFRVWNLNSYV